MEAERRRLEAIATTCRVRRECALTSVTSTIAAAERFILNELMKAEEEARALQEAQDEEKRLQQLEEEIRLRFDRDAAAAKARADEEAKEAAERSRIARVKAKRSTSRLHTNHASESYTPIV